MYIFSHDVGKRAKHQFVAGLSWEPLVPDSFKQRLLPLAEQLRADLYVYRRTDKAMVGFASQASGAKPGQIPVALVVVDALERESRPKNALVALQLEEGVYSYIMIRDGFVIAGFDKVGEEAEVQELFTTHLGSAADFDVLICPTAWKVRGAVERDFGSFLPVKGKTIKIPEAWQLRPIKPSRGKAILKFALPLALIYAAYSGFGYWQKNRAERLAVEAAAQQVAAANAARQMRVSAEPWPAIPTAQAVVDACQAALLASKVIVPGWTFGGFSCDSGAMSMSWTRADGRSQISALKETIPTAVIAPDGGSASLIVPLTISIDPNAPREELPNSTQRFYQLRDLEGSAGIVVAVKEGPAGPKIVEGVPLHWTDFQFTVDTRLDPREVVKAISVPGMRISKVTGAISDGLFKYQLHGVQYAKP